jgi:methyl-accepting chemotaxis protein
LTREVEQAIQDIGLLFQQRVERNEIQDLIHNVVADLDELDDTIKIVQSNPSRFQLDKRQVEERKAFVNSTRQVVQDYQLRLDNLSKKAKLETKSRNIQSTMENESQLQQQILETQDKQIDEVAITVRNMREIGRVMGNELDDQTRLLGEVEEHVDQTKNRMEDGMKRMKEFIKQNSSVKQQLAIIGLIFLLIVLLIIVISF